MAMASNKYGIWSNESNVYFGYILEGKGMEHCLAPLSYKLRTFLLCALRRADSIVVIELQPIINANWQINFKYQR